MNVELKNNRPELRFSEFSEEWKKEALDEYIELLSGFAFKGEDISENSNGIPLLRGINITEGYIRHSKDIDRYYEGDLNNLLKFILLENDLVLGMDGSKVGKNVALIEEQDAGSLLIQRVARIRSNEKSNINYIYQNIFSTKFRRYVDKVNTSSGIPHISSKQIKEFKIAIPNPTEQTKIATFLTAVDKRINLLQKKKAELEQYKKGVMQKLFSVKTDSVKTDCNPSLRFKNDDGSDFPDWEVKKLGEVGEIINGLTYSPKNINEKGVLVLRSSNVKNRALKFNDNVFVLTDSFNPVMKNDILICVRNGSKRLIGKNVIIDKETEGVAFGAFMTVYRSAFNSFLYHWFDTDEYKKEVHKNLGATINSINGSDLKKFKVPFPSKEEQQKIANFLSSIDKSIDNMTNQIDDSVIFKKGLLQKMFV
jgi:type I restriction enzyme S subunit